MWRQMFRVLPKSKPKAKQFTHVFNTHATRRRFSTATATPKKTIFWGTVTAQATAAIYELSNDNNISDDFADKIATEIDEMQLASDIELTFAESGKALNDLIRTLHACVLEICEQYQHCLARQIEITVANMELDLIGPHWDELTKYRVLSDDLRLELLKYRTLIATIGSIVKNDSFNGKNLNDHSIDEMLIIKAYDALVELIEMKTKENSKWETKLLDVHKKSILGGH